MQCCAELPFIKSDLDNVVQLAKDYAGCHGIVLRTKENPLSADQIVHAPFLLLPSPVPKHCFTYAVQVQQDLNILMHNVAHDYQFLKEALQSTIKADEFTGKLWDIYETVRKEGITQSLSLGLLRADYMFDCGKPSLEALKSGFNFEDCKIKQIEINTMASSFAGLCSSVSKFHKLVVDDLNSCHTENRCPENNALNGLAEGIITAWNHYKEPKSVILFLVADGERNIYDQRLIEFSMKKIQPGIKVLRKSLQYLTKEARLDSEKRLMVDGQEVAVVYFRMAYVPEHFTCSADWEMRLLIERSKAIKCPNIYYHLAGTKKVQQVLACSGMVEKYIPDKEAAQRIRRTFAGQFSLDMGEEGDKTVKMALENPCKYVLKPQREGGGHNIFGDDIPKVLSKIADSEERTAYIIMERIQPAPLRNYALQVNDEVQLLDMVSELGIFGVVFGSADNIVLNKQEGHILRTKTIGTDEGGVSAGFAALDSPYLI